MDHAALGMRIPWARCRQGWRRSFLLVLLSGLRMLLGDGALRYFLPDTELPTFQMTLEGHTMLAKKTGKIVLSVHPTGMTTLFSFKNHSPIRACVSRMATS